MKFGHCLNIATRWSVQSEFNAPWLSSGAFHLDERQHALLEIIRFEWGEDCVIQIYGGRICIRTDGGGAMIYKLPRRWR